MPRHSFVSGKTQGGDATIVDANEWNAPLIPISSTFTAQAPAVGTIPLTITAGVSAQVLNLERVDITCDNDNDADIAVLPDGTVNGHELDLVVVSVGTSTTNTCTIQGKFSTSGGTPTTSYLLPQVGTALVGCGMRVRWNSAETYWEIDRIFSVYPCTLVDVFETVGSDPPVLKDKLQFYAKNIGGRLMPKWIGPSGVDTPFQPFIGFNKIISAGPGSTSNTLSAAFASIPAAAITNAGTGSQVAMGTGATVKAKARWIGFATGTTAGNMATCITPSLEAKIADGFFFTVRFGAGGTIQSGQRGFCGMWASVTPATNLDPTTATTPARIGIGYALTGTTGNLKIVAASGSAVFTAVDLGASFAINNSNIFELVLFCAPGATSISYRVKNLETNVEATGTISGNIPTSTTLLAMQCWVTNNATAAAATMLLNKLYLETDY